MGIMDKMDEMKDKAQDNLNQTDVDEKLMDKMKNRKSEETMESDDNKAM